MESKSDLIILKNCVQQKQIIDKNEMILLVWWETGGVGIVNQDNKQLELLALFNNRT